MKKYIVYLILCFVSCLIFSCTSVYENGDTSCIPEGMENPGGRLRARRVT